MKNKKVMIISDIHGSYYYLNRAFKTFKNNKCDTLIILGDYLYHGPRNKIPKGYNIEKCIKLINENKDRIIGIRGNCDSKIDCQLLSLNLFDNLEEKINEKTYFFTHGDEFNINNKPEGNYDCIIYGHFHKQLKEKIGKTTYYNPGSISLTKEDSKHGYIIIENNETKLFDLLTNKEICL